MASVIQGLPAHLPLQHRGFIRLPVLGTDGLRDDRLCIRPLWRTRPGNTRRGSQPDRIQPRHGRRGNGVTAAHQHILWREEPSAHKKSDEIRHKGRDYRRPGGHGADLAILQPVLRTVRNPWRREPFPLHHGHPYRIAGLYILQRSVPDDLLLYAYWPDRYGDVLRMPPERSVLHPPSDSGFKAFRHQRNVGRFRRFSGTEPCLRHAVCLSAVRKRQFPLPAEGYGFGCQSHRRRPHGRRCGTAVPLHERRNQFPCLHQYAC